MKLLPNSDSSIHHKAAFEYYLNVPEWWGIRRDVS